MTEPLTQAGYLSTKKKLANMEARLTALRARTDLDPAYRSGVERSYLDMMRQYLRELQLYEAAQGSDRPGAGEGGADQAGSGATPLPTGN
jgi:hypothetical protein